MILAQTSVIDRHLRTILIVNPDWRSFTVVFIFLFNIHFIEEKKIRSEKHYMLKLVEKENSVDEF